VLVVSTSDGGLTWSTAFQDEFPFAQRWFRSVAFLDQRVGFVSVQDSVDVQKPRAAMLYTADGGHTWVRAEMDRSIAACKPLAHILFCAGSDTSSEDFWTAKVSRLYPK
jgi:photosystem II stability/assembly factor-like uncharacterized protein